MTTADKIYLNADSITEQQLLPANQCAVSYIGNHPQKPVAHPSPNESLELAIHLHDIEV